MILARGPAKEAGFTIIEVLVAATLLLVGMLGVVTMVSGANSAVASAREREAATNLAREIAEQARSIPYSQVDAATLEPRLQAMAGLESSTTAPLWTVSRRGTTYEVDVAVCSVDDSRDGYGDHTDGGYCDATEGVADSTPRDLKRVTIDVTWDDRGKQRTARQVAVVSPGNGRDAPLVKSLTATSPTFSDPTHPVVTAASTTQVTFTVVGSTTATRIIWSLDGVDQVPAPVPAAAPKTWTFTLPLTGLSDGTYSIGARAVDANDVEGPPHEIPLDLLRGIPAAPTIVASGFNTVNVAGVSRDVVEIEWLANTERNVQGYRVYRPDGSLACPGDATIPDERLDCVDTAPIAGEYEVAAVFRDINGVLTDGVLARTTPPGLMTSIPPGPRRFYFTTIAATGANCGAGGRDMLTPAPTATGAPSVVSLGSTTARWCSPASTETITVPASPLGAETTRVEARFRNTSGGNGHWCSVTASAALNNGTPATDTVSVPPRMSSTQVPAASTFVFSHGALSIAPGARFTVFFTGSGVGCNNTTVLHASTQSPSFFQFQHPGSTAPAARPDAPTGLTITPTTEGPKLTWTAPAGGAPVEGYRIYRGGTDYTDRYDKTGDTIPEYSDPKPKPGLEYWVTAVGPNLVESPMAGPVTTP